MTFEEWIAKGHNCFTCDKPMSSSKYWDGLLYQCGTEHNIRIRYFLQEDEVEEQKLIYSYLHLYNHLLNDGILEYMPKYLIENSSQIIPYENVNLNEGKLIILSTKLTNKELKSISFEDFIKIDENFIEKILLLL